MSERERERERDGDDLSLKLKPLFILVGCGCAASFFRPAWVFVLGRASIGERLEKTLARKILSFALKVRRRWRI